MEEAIETFPLNPIVTGCPVELTLRLVVVHGILNWMVLVAPWPLMVNRPEEGDAVNPGKVPIVKA